MSDIIYNRRLDGRLERICPHGVGHTVEVPKAQESVRAWRVHGCDGCCATWKDKLPE